MSCLPAILKLSPHAKQRLDERKDDDTYYDTENIMRSTCKWYGIDDLIPESSLYVHARYVCRKAKSRMKYITNGKIEIIYDKNVNVAITVMEVKDKFRPITQFIKPEVLAETNKKKESKRLNKLLKQEYNIIYKEEFNNIISIAEYIGLGENARVKEAVWV